MAERNSTQQGLPLDLVSANDSLRPRQPMPLPRAVSFDRRELQTILNLYGRKVAAGEWRDYAMDVLKDRAVFSIYRHHSERPIYIIEKDPRLRDRQGQYLVTGQNGRVLKRGNILGNVLRVLEPHFTIIR